MIKILVVSDTHNDNFWLNYFNFDEYDYILHAGDHQLNKDGITAITQYYVDGNNDWGSMIYNTLEIAGYKFGITHGHEFLMWFLNGSKMYHKLRDFAVSKQLDVLIFGHTHIPFAQYFNNILLLNPGSMHYSRHNGTRCYSVIKIDEHHKLSVENYEIPRK